ncbi:MAG: acyltransferase family protein [Acidimicrobiales bacterium]
MESLRALAALGVLEGHVFATSRGYGAGLYDSFLHRTLLGGGSGVFLFFTLTGYLLYRPFARRDFAGGDQVNVRRYAANRVFRILPLYYVVLVAYVVAFDHGGSFTTWWRSLLFVENVFPQTLTHIDGVMWSLATEVQFYVLLPVFAYVMGRATAGSARRSAGILVGIGLAAEAIRLVTVTLPHAPSLGWKYSLPSTFVYFVPGMVLAVIETGWPGFRSRLRGWSRHGSAWFVASLPLWLIVMWRYDLDVLIVPATFLMVGGVVLPLERGAVTRALEWRPLAALGVASYSLYLWHFPIVNHVGSASWAPHGYLPLLVVCAVLNCAVALVSYRVVEAPFLRLRRAWSAPARMPTNELVVESGGPTAAASPSSRPRGIDEPAVG